MKFETSRLIIRPPVIEDAEDIFRNYAQDSEVTRYLTWRPHRELKETLSWVNFCVQNCNTQSSVIFVIYAKETHETIGMIDFRLEGYKAHCGYVLAKKYWNQGVMTEAMQPVIHYLATSGNIYRIWAVHDVENEASGKVLEKLGMRCEGVVAASLRHPNISNEPRDGVYYSLDCRTITGD
ncbi:GNAT family N-acetyltransferase [Pseudaeromonas sharmana]|uniref:GNAT family N-acetyltransferase n=1 Tax=Pseudaeromonas sharmana TaxID=328412 RepID=A0ABV8CIT0_9GAMM